MSQSTVFRLVLPLVFPAGIHPGAGKDGGNRLQIARDGQGRCVLRGTALAGALRHAWARSLDLRSDAHEVARWFGCALSRDEDAPSLLRVGDAPLDTGGNDSLFRHHNAVDRHTGAVRERALFDVEALPPYTRCKVVLELACETEQEGLGFLSGLIGLLSDGLVRGGSGARGIGRAELDGQVRYRCFDLTDLTRHAAFLDERYATSTGEHVADGERLEPVRGRGNALCVDLLLAVPRGQDLLVGDGQGLDYEMEPQRVRGSDGQHYWRLPGSSLRGVFRAWFSRLAARDGKEVADSAARYRQRGGPASGDDVAWGFRDAKERENDLETLDVDPRRLDEVVHCPVMRLFGSSFARGRIHIGDSLVKLDPENEQERAHVAVDSFTGGANEGFFFQNTVLHGVSFPVSVTIERPTEEEAGWLARTLRALDMGVLRVGCSKSAGRLALAEKVSAVGPFSEALSDLEPMAREG